MRKIHVVQTVTRIIITFLAIALSCVLFLSGCDLFTYKRPFPDAYYDNNFIAAIGFDQFAGDVAIVPSSATIGQWDFAYRYEPGWGTSPYNYMTLVDTGSIASGIEAVPAGLSGTAPVYRLNVVNLFSAGDFEADTNGVWGTTGTASATRSLFSPLFGTYSMLMTAGPGEIITYTPTAVAGSPFNTNYTYKTFFRYSSTDAILSYADSTAITFDPSSSSAVASFEGTLSVPVFTFKPAQNSSLGDLKVDNFRLTKSGGMSLRLLLSITDTVPALESGVYSFSVWVHTDSVASTTVSPYQLDSFFIKMRPVNTSLLQSTSSWYVPAAGWQKLTATLAPGALSFTDALLPVMELVLDCNFSKPGQVLLAQPTLIFHPDGL